MIVLPFQTLFTPDIPPSTEWKNAGWEVQPPQPPSKPKLGAGAMFATGLMLVLTQPSVIQTWINVGEEIQPVQPPHPRPEKAAAILRGDDGAEARLINWFNFGWEIQQHQPPHPRPERSAAIMPVVNIDPVFIQWINSGAEVQPLQPPHPRPERSAAGMRGDDGAQAVFINWKNIGWEIQPPQPPHPRSERSGALAFGDLGTEAVFTTVVVTVPAWGWELQSFQPPAYPSARQKYVGTKGRSEFRIFPDPQPMEWFVPFNIKYPKTEKAAAIVFGDTGTEAPFIPTVVTAAVWGWDNQPMQPRTYPTLAQRGIAAAGESTFAASQLDPFGWEAQPAQPPRPRVERRGAIFTPANIDSVFVQSAAPFTPLGGFEFQPLTSRFIFKGGALAKGDDGTQGPFVNWRNAGAEVQPWQPPHFVPEKRGAYLRGDDGIQRPLINWFNAGWEIQPPPPPHRAPERKAAAFLRGDDGNQAAFINWLVDGWAIQPPQPPHPRPERSAAVLFGDTGIEAPYVFVAPPPLSPWGYEVQSHVFFKRPVGSALAGAININAVYVFVPPPPPPPPAPIPVQFRSKVFAVNCAQGNTNVAVSSETNVFNPVTVGMSITLVVSSGNSLPPNTPGQTLVITKPDGTVIRLIYPDAFIGTLDTMTDVGLFPGGTYLVGGVYLDQAGFWSVQVVKSPVATALGPFFVSPA